MAGVVVRWPVVAVIADLGAGGAAVDGATLLRLLDGGGVVKYTGIGIGAHPWYSSSVGACAVGGLLVW